MSDILSAAASGLMSSKLCRVVEDRFERSFIAVANTILDSFEVFSIFPLRPTRCSSDTPIRLPRMWF
jgi:hypothetical protein